MKAPFPWFGGKRRVAPEVWSALGDVDHYVEPFAGSLAVLLERPGWHEGETETVNDADAMLANFWRAVTHAPDEVARWADWPVNETDLIARHAWLVTTGRERITALESDPEHFDAQVAGWWVWGICSWIGGGWCSGTGPWRVIDGTMTDTRRRPHMGTAGQGVSRRRPHLDTAGQGVSRRRQHLGTAGQGVHSGPSFAGGGSGQARSVWTGSPGVEGYFRALADRLRRVRVCCGDWSRIVTNGALAHGASVGVFLDPPYSGDVRRRDIYATEGHDVAVAVRQWAVAHGDDPRLRIVLAGYEPEHVAHMPESWRMIAWVGSGGMATSKSAARGSGGTANRELERLWLSPACLTDQASLFDAEPTS